MDHRCFVFLSSLCAVLLSSSPSFPEAAPKSDVATAATTLSGRAAHGGRADRRASGSPSTIYLYAQLSGGGIGRFAINDGVLASQPSSTLNADASGASGIAVGSDGSLYVESGTPSGAVVSVYAPGAQGNDAPVRQLTISSFTYGTIAVDSQGYLYSINFFVKGYSAGTDVDVYPPGASGPAQPVESFEDFGYFMSFDSAGNLYISNDNSGIDVWAQPASNPRLVRTICLRDQAVGVAGNPGGVTFVSVAPRRARRKHPPGIVAIPATEKKCNNKQTAFQTSPTFEVRSALVQYGDQLFLNSGGTLFEIPETGSYPRTPTAMVSGASSYPGLAIGP